MQADERTRTVIHREWTLPAPAHHTEVIKALAAASQKRDAETGYPSDIVFTHGDDEIVIGYQVEQRPGQIAVAADAILRAERDEAQRKAKFAMATIKRARQLAIDWSADSAGALRAASRELHAILDGPGDETEVPDHA